MIKISLTTLKLLGSDAADKVFFQKGRISGGIAHARIRTLAIMLLSILLVACAAKQPQMRDCETVYVILPGNFIIDLAGGSKVILEPSVQDFALFCTPKDAAEALKESQIQGDWRIYRMAGALAQIGKPHESGGYMLASPAEVSDWLEMAP